MPLLCRSPDPDRCCVTVPLSTTALWLAGTMPNGLELESYVEESELSSSEATLNPRAAAPAEPLGRRISSPPEAGGSMLPPANDPESTFLQRPMPPGTHEHSVVHEASRGFLFTLVVPF